MQVRREEREREERRKRKEKKEGRHLRSVRDMSEHTDARLGGFGIFVPCFCAHPEEMFASCPG